MLTKFVDEKFPKWVKILLAIFGGYSVVYRAFIYVDDCIAKKEEKDVKALVFAILMLFLWPLTIVAMIIDIIALVNDKPTNCLTSRTEQGTQE